MNAKQEFQQHTKGLQVKCAQIKIGGTYDANNDVNMGGSHNLYEGYKKDLYKAFLVLIDVEYDDGYGRQELHGTIWYKDGTWSTRGGEYDGSEWWVYHVIPEIPDELKKPRTEKINDFLMENS